MNFKKEKKKLKKTITDVDKNYETGEAAFAAYAHKNPLIDFLFWERIKVAYTFTKKKPEIKNFLDFGCGSGILSYLLAKENYNVTACDIEMEPLRMVQKQISFPNNIKFYEGDILNHNLCEKSFDMIFALDVLEHIEDLTPYLDLFEKLLTPNGIIIVSGPSENYLYKIGRKIAGKRFSGEYHTTNIRDIRKKFQAQWETKTIKKLFYPFVLFEIFSATKR